MKDEVELDLADLRAVLAVAESASYTRAAQKLGLTQPAISRRITALEQSLDTRLFRREGGAFVDLEPMFDYHLGIVYPLRWKQSSPLDGRPMPQALSLAEAARLPLLVASQNQSMRHLIDAEFRSAGLKPNVVMEVNSFVLQRSL